MKLVAYQGVGISIPTLVTQIVHERTYTLESLTTGSAGLFVTGLVKQYVGLLLGVLPEI